MVGSPRPAGGIRESGGGRDVEQATFAGGCFWCLEPVFEELRGVVQVVPGYAGGRTPNPSYEQVCSGATGHAECIDVLYDPQQIRYRDLLEVFFSVHDPTTPNRQGADVGTQYRSAIYYRSPEQESTARAFLRDLAPDPTWQGRAVVTELAPLTAFHPAEDYHRRYFRRNPAQGYCRVVIAPKLQKFRKRFAGTPILED